MTMALRIGIDIGGTFTDATAISESGIKTAKVPSNPSNPGEAVLAAVNALELEERPERFLHGTTLVTNMLLERKGAPTGFITGADLLQRQPQILERQNAVQTGQLIGRANFQPLVPHDIDPCFSG